jgi:uncharacterized protein (TIGR02594 family)
MTILELVIKWKVLKEGQNGEHVKELQRALRKTGAELIIDGDFGTYTRIAVERFQASAGIAADGMVGPITATYLDAFKGPPLPGSDRPLPPVSSVVPWLTYMRAITGTKEIPGAKSNPLILSWVRSLGARYPALRPNIGWYVNDDTPWCGLGCAEAVGNCDPGYMPPIAPLRALNWSVWDMEVDEPFQGAIAVKTRTGGGHVTLVESIYGRKIYCRGANQSNMINVAEYNISDFKWFRWPSGAAPPKGKPVSKKYIAEKVTEA